MRSPLADALPTAEIARVLVTKLRHHGDVLLATPVLTTLRRALPRAEVDALVYRETAPLVEHHPALAHLHTIDRTWKQQGLAHQLKAERALLAQLRSRRYDLLVHLTEHPRGLSLARFLRPRFAVTRERATTGEKAWLWKRHFTHFYRLPRATPRHAVEANLDALRRVGIQPTVGDKILALVPGVEAERRVDALLSQHALARRGFVQLHPGSRWLFKCWPAESMAALADRIAAQGLRMVVTGAPDPRERELVDAMLAVASPGARTRIVDLVGALSLQELAAVSARARAFVGVDSAPMHIAAAMGTPTVALFGPSGEHEWGPWQVPSRVVTSEVHRCRPCGIDGCGGGKISECLTTLPVERVFAAFVSLLFETSGPA
jgi:heptosyltransferase-3